MSDPIKDFTTEIPFWNPRITPIDLDAASEQQLDAMKAHVIETYNKEGKALFATARLWDDGLIDPRDSRKALAFCLSICREGDVRELQPNTFGVARM